MPRLAENGNIVPVTVTVDSPMTEQDYVKSIHLFAEKQSAAAHSGRGTRAAQRPSPRLLRAIRVAISQQMHAVAVMSDGTLWSTAVESK